MFLDSEGVDLGLTLLAAKSSSSQDVVSQLPPNKAVAMFDFAAEQPGDLGLRKGMVVDLLETDGAWWKGSDAVAADTRAAPRRAPGGGPAKRRPTMTAPTGGGVPPRPRKKQR